MVLPTSLGTLREAVAAGRIPDRPVKDELRDNVIDRLVRRAPLFPGLVGYEESVVPQVANAILSRHNFILLGLRGQAKTRLLRSLADLLDEVIPVIPGCEIHDHPLRPICAACRSRVATEEGDLPVGWLPRERRYVEKLATPDVTIADLIGDVDPIKAARSGRELSDELTMHYGLLPRANRGVFAVNELPDLAGKVQVGLFNILQEGDVQIKGYPVRLPLDVLLVFSANPEDYTARGKIITPLKDRIGSEVRTHYPRTRPEAMAITAQEAWLDRPARQRDGLTVEIPGYVREIVEEIAFAARSDQKVDRRSGVSQRLPITVLENVVSNAERRALLHVEMPVVPRVGDVYAALPSITGKIELEYEGELRGAEDVAQELIRNAVARVFDGHMALGDANRVIAWFEEGGSLELSDVTASADLLAATEPVAGLAELAAALGAGDSEPVRASIVDFILEGLHALKKISRTDAGRLYAEAPARRDDHRDLERLMEMDEDDETPTDGRKRKKYYN